MICPGRSAIGIPCIGEHTSTTGVLVTVDVCVGAGVGGWAGSLVRVGCCVAVCAGGGRVADGRTGAVAGAHAAKSHRRRSRKMCKDAFGRMATLIVTGNRCLMPFDSLGLPSDRF